MLNMLRRKSSTAKAAAPPPAASSSSSDSKPPEATPARPAAAPKPVEKAKVSKPNSMKDVKDLLPPKPPSALKSSEEAKQKALQEPASAELERAEVPGSEEGQRRTRASRRISQTQFGKPLTYNDFLRAQAAAAAEAERN